MGVIETHRVIEAVWRIESARLIAGLARMTHDVGLAEELAQDALLAALEQWPGSGVPDNPGAWLMAIAKRRAIDHFRRADTFQRKVAELGRDLEDRHETFEAEVLEAVDDDIGDDLLRLIFTACHPVLSAETRVALTLRLLGGLTTEEIARAYLVPEPTIGQRITRAKKTLAAKQIPYEIPQGQELAPRLASVLEVIYAIFNEGYSATAGEQWTRPTLCEEALRLGRILAGLAPDQPEVHGLVALMEIQASRLRARLDRHGKPVVLLQQNRALWDRLAIDRGLRALHRAEELGGEDGPYALQAAIAACHARAFTADRTDWERIAGLYERLGRITPSPVVELNRAVAVAMAFGPKEGLEMVDALEAGGALRNYHLLPSVRADFLVRMGKLAQAKVEFERAAALTRNASERELLLGRARELDQALGRI
jgi:RNA polymerase sigma factor (sigma-70 family)